jgi:hypothetical protein
VRDNNLFGADSVHLLETPSRPTTSAAGKALCPLEDGVWATTMEQPGITMAQTLISYFLALQPLHNVMVRTDANAAFQNFMHTGPYLLISYPIEKI